MKFKLIHILDIRLRMKTSGKMTAEGTIFKIRCKDAIRLRYMESLLFFQVFTLLDLWTSISYLAILLSKLTTVT